ncbi:MAG: NADH-quinone oxidoreductase subunit C [Candidatus Omnitrophica bacterium]|nr:NADH-quinone oxidoreductase subunit C [Candidatus Omnitrophota bacterium]MDD5653147.1 NADH-quinone oxidoreductase subunit C [Candidatus Omnitrophota bacterium]
MNIRDNIKESLGSRILDWQEKFPRRVYFTVKKEDIVAITRIIFKDLGLRFVIASATHTPQGFEILYHFSYDKAGEIYSARVFLDDKKNPQIDSIATLFPGAEWIEREIWEMLGIKFIGHPNLKRLLLADDWPEGNFPLRHKEG